MKKLNNDVFADVYCQSMITKNINNHYTYMKQKEGERERDAGETERECAREGG